MKNEAFQKLAKQLLPSLPGFFARGALVADRSVPHVLRGLYFESSSFDTKSFYVWVFFMPLFVPAQHLSFNLGKRLRNSAGGDRWDADAPNLLENLQKAVTEEGLPFFANVKSPDDIAKVSMKFRDSGDPYVQEAVAYAWARAGQIIRANDELEKLLSRLDVTIPWQSEMKERAETLKARILERSLEAQRQLDAWEALTVRNLKLDTTPAPAPSGRISP